VRRKLPFISLVPVSLALLALPVSAAPLITEFLTNNNAGLLDEDNTRQDWIEIHNPDGAEVDLGGYHLTDNAALATKWTFPADFLIPPGGYVVIFASGKNRVVVGAPLHTNFGLASSGEYLGLYAPGGAGAALSEFAPAFPPQSPDVSYGLISPAPGSNAAYFNTPTPGAPNLVDTSPADAVIFSMPSQTFNQGGSLAVELSTASGNPEIRYTLNRAVPIAVQGTTGNFTANSATEVLTLTAHDLKDRDEVQVATTGALPGGLGIGLNYYAKVLSPNTLQLSRIPGGAPVDLTSNGSGTNSIRRHAAYFTAATSGLLTTTEHRFQDRDEVQVSSTGTLPTGLSAGTSYYVVAVDRNTYRLSLTPGGATVGISTVGSGTHTLRRMVSPIYATALTVSYSQRIRARTFEAGRADGPVRSESYLALDAAAQAFTSNIPVFILHSWGSGHPNATAQTPEDTKQAVWFVFEPKAEGANLVTRLTNMPDLTVPAYFERRGSSTFGALKYSMTMGAYDESDSGLDVSPLGFASNDDFVLNAHYEFDRSLMHNDLIYRLSNEAGRYAAKTRHVEVFMSVNNDIGASGGNPPWGLVTGGTTAADYYGVYSFQDKLSRGNNRIDVEKLGPEDNTAPNVQGGYVFKIDRLDTGDAGLGAGGRTFALVQPKEFTSYPSHLPVMTPQQKSYLQTTLNNMYAACTSPNFMSPTLGYAAHLDVPAAIDHHILSLAPKSADAFRLSGFWHKSRYGKLVMGPIFDFDRAMGSTDGRDLNPRTWRGDVGDLGTDYFHNASIYSPNYFHWMFQDPNFWQAWIDRLEELRQGVLSTAHVHALIDEYTELLDPGNGPNTPAKRNFQKFTAVPPRGASGNTPGTNGTFRGEAQWLKNWWGKAGAVTQDGRLDFMDGQFTRPAAADLPSGPVAGGSTVSLMSPSSSTPGVKIYYTTDGTDPRKPATAPLPTAGTGVTIATILPEISPVRAIVPTGDIGVTWRDVGFDDSAWFTNAPGTINGVGYDNNFAAGQVDYHPYINLRWNTAAYNPTSNPPVGISPVSAANVMRNEVVAGTNYAGNQTCYIRWPFTLSPADFALVNGANKVFLQVRYDDGFVAWLNGTELTPARGNAPATPSLTWNSAATGTHDDNAAVLYVDYEITAFSGSFVSGDNVLAIQSLNSGLTSSDLVCQVKMIIQSPPPPYEPEVAAGAIEYTAPLPLTEPTALFVRAVNPVLPSDPPTAGGGGTGPVPNGSSWSAPTRYYYFPGAVTASQASIRISEVHYHPDPPTLGEVSQGWTNSNDFEFIRLTNTGASPVDLTGIYFSNGVGFTALPGLQNWLPSGSSAVVVENIAAFTSRYGSTFTILGRYDGELDNGGEHIVLNDKTGAVISDFRYDDIDPWPTRADNGYSLLYVSGDQNLPGSWRSSLDPGGTSATNYTGWVGRYFNGNDPMSQLMTRNDDGDVLNNLGEYAFGTDPRVAGRAENAITSFIAGNPSLFGMRRRVGATDVTYYFETSTDLASGNWISPAGPPSGITDNGDGTETLIWEVPAVPEGSPQYLRARVTSP
jgi:hypothetical protein